MTVQCNTELLIIVIVGLSLNVFGYLGAQISIYLNRKEDSKTQKETIEKLEALYQEHEVNKNKDPRGWLWYRNIETKSLIDFIYAKVADSVFTSNFIWGFTTIVNLSILIVLIIASIK